MAIMKNYGAGTMFGGANVALICRGMSTGSNRGAAYEHAVVAKEVGVDGH